MLNLNSTTLQQVVEKAAHDAANHPRWLTAIGRAILELDCNPWIERNDHGGLLIGSPSAAVYSANGVCQCTAYTGMLNGKQVHNGGLPCWHRAAARLVRLHDEREAAQHAALLHSTADLIDKPGTPIGVESYGDVAQADHMRIARKIAAARATAALNELFA